MSAYLDASVLVPTLVEQDATEAVRDYLRAIGRDRVVSDFAAAEVAAALSRLVRMGLLDSTEAGARLVDFDAWRTATSITADVRPADARLAYAFVRRFELRLRAPDALHLAIASRLGAGLVTLDHRLAGAANALGISVAVPSDLR